MSFTKKFCWAERWPVIRLTGPGVRSFLHGQTTAEFLTFKQDLIAHACLLTPTGRVRAILEVKLDNDGAYVIVLGGNIDKVVNSFGSSIFPADNVYIQDSEEVNRLQIISEEQPRDSRNITWLFRDEETPDSFRDYAFATQSQVDEWSIKQGFPLRDSELGTESNPFELGLSDLVNLNKGCYLGQETISKLSNKGIIKQELRYWESDSKVIPGEFIGFKLDGEDSFKKSGLILSSLYDSSIQKTIGLAMLKRHALHEKNLSVMSKSQIVSIKIPLGFKSLKDIKH